MVERTGSETQKNESQWEPVRASESHESQNMRAIESYESHKKEPREQKWEPVRATRAKKKMENLREEIYARARTRVVARRRRRNIKIIKYNYFLET